MYIYIYILIVYYIFEYRLVTIYFDLECVKKKKNKINHCN